MSKLKLEHGCYQWAATINGSRYRLSTGCTDKAEAQRWVAETTRKILLGEYPLRESRDAPIASTMSLSQAARKAELGQWKIDLGKATLKQYVAQVTYIVELKGDLRLCDIDEDVIESIRDALCECDRDLDNTTVNRYLAALSSLLAIAHRQWRVIKRKPSFCMFPESAGRISLFTKDEIDLILRSSKDQDFSDFILFLYETGCRLSEGLRLTEKDVDLDSGVIRLWETKNDQPRGVPMTAKLRVMMERRDGRVWSYTKDAVRSRWDGLRKSLGKTDDAGWIIHVLRHTRATRMLEAGISIYSVQKWLGHKRIETTQRYAKMTRQQLDDAVKLIDSFEDTNARKLRAV